MFIRIYLKIVLAFLSYDLAWLENQRQQDFCQNLKDRDDAQIEKGLIDSCER